MRCIKFRAWDKIHKKILSVEHIVWRGKKIFYIIVIDGENIFVLIPEDFVLMQFTGLLDKNGKEIYEGDIVKVSVAYIEEGKPVTAIVEWVESFGSVGFHLKQIYDFESKKYEGWDLYDVMGSNFNFTKDCEVIGNIYMNPELIK